MVTDVFKTRFACIFLPYGGPRRKNITRKHSVNEDGWSPSEPSSTEASRLEGGDNQKGQVNSAPLCDCQAGLFTWPLSSLINQEARLYPPNWINIKSKEADAHKQIEKYVVGETPQAVFLFKENER